MSRSIDPKNVVGDDASYLLDRPWMIDEFRRQGFDKQMDAVVAGADVRNSPEEKSRVHTDQMRVGTQGPQILEPAASGVLSEDDEVDDNYEEWKVSELKAEIDARNKERGPDDQLSLGGNKEDLVARLHQADEEDMAEASA
jgi:hypothetical protein